jgi:stage II sporulation protein D
MTTPLAEGHRVPWVAMTLALAALLTSLLAACRVAPVDGRAVAVPEPPRFTARADGPDIRVRIEREIESARLDAPGLIIAFAGPSAEPAWTGQGPLTVRRTGGGYLIEPQNAVVPAPRLRLLTASGPFTAGTGEDAWTLDGALELVARPDVSDGVFDLIESLPIERYLPGVLAKELYYDFRPETYRAQAIAARTYALHERERRMSVGSHFDVESTTMDQAYAGADSHPRAAAAAADTAGRVLTWRGGILRTYYSSTCGDRPASARDTWPTTRGFEFNLAEPIQASPRPCACTISPRHRWTLERPAAGVAKRFARWGAENGHPIRALEGLRSINVQSRNAAGRPSAFRVADARGRRYELSAEHLRLAFNTGATGVPGITRETRVLSGDLRVQVRGGAVRIEGRGFGHGVGMCQFGAEGLARQGVGHEAILARYYPGATLERAY